MLCGRCARVAEDSQLRIVSNMLHDFQELFSSNLKTAAHEVVKRDRFAKESG